MTDYALKYSSLSNYRLYLETRKVLVYEMSDGRERRRLDHLRSECLKRDERIWLDAVTDANTTASDIILFEITNEVTTVHRIDHCTLRELEIFFPNTTSSIFELPAETLLSGYEVIKVDGDSMINAGIRQGDEVLSRKTDTADDLDIVIVEIDEKRVIKTLSKDDHGDYWLYSENDRFPYPMRLSEYMNWKLKGVVVRKLERCESPRRRALRERNIV